VQSAGGNGSSALTTNDGDVGVGSSALGPASEAEGTAQGARRTPCSQLVAMALQPAEGRTKVGRLYRIGLVSNGAKASPRSDFSNASRVASR
jgi:hypothetical protein